MAGSEGQVEVYRVGVYSSSNYITRCDSVSGWILRLMDGRLQSQEWMEVVLTYYLGTGWIKGDRDGGKFREIFLKKKIPRNFQEWR